MAKQSGFLMIIVAVLLVVIGGLATAFVSMLVNGTSSSISTISANNAYNLAQTGLENGSYQLYLGNCDNNWSSINTISGQGEYQYKCVPKQPPNTTITSSLSATTTSIPVASVTYLDDFGAITIDSETIYYDGKNGNNLINAQRKNGTTHSSGAIVTQSQYIISSQAGSPSLSTPSGAVTLSQAVTLSNGNNNSNYFVVSTQGVILNYNGTSWSVAGSALGLNFSAIETSINYGLAVGYTTALLSTIYQFNGTSWSLMGLLPLANAKLTSVSCDLPNNPTLCWTGGQRLLPTAASLLYNTATGQPYFTGSGTISFLSCTNSTCIATRDNDLFSFPANSNNPFALPPIKIPGNTINGADCAQANSCILLRNNGNVFYFDGSSLDNTSVSNQTFNAVHCFNASNCMVVGNNGVIFNCSVPIISSSSCIAQATPGTLNLQKVHCNSANDCLAIGTGSLAYRYTGGTWSAISVPLGYTLTSLSGVGTGTSTGVTPMILHNLRNGS